MLWGMRRAATARISHAGQRGTASSGDPSAAASAQATPAAVDGGNVGGGPAAEIRQRAQTTATTASRPRGNPRQQPANPWRSTRAPPAWMFKVPQGVREFIVMGPVIAVCSAFIWHYSDFLAPDYLMKRKRMDVPVLPEGKTARFEEIRNDEGKLVAYRYIVEDKSPPDVAGK